VQYLLGRCGGGVGECEQLQLINGRALSAKRANAPASRNYYSETVEAAITRPLNHPRFIRNSLPDMACWSLPRKSSRFPK